MRTQLATSCLLITLSGISPAEETMTLSDEADRINYSIGHQIGSDFKKQQVNLDAVLLRQGIQDGYDTQEPRIDRQEMQSALADLKSKISSDMREKALVQMKARQDKTKRIRSEGQAFLEANQQKEGVETLPSGLQYKVITPGNGPKPGLQDQVSIHFRSRTLEGKEYSSSYKHGKPYTTKVINMLPGVAEALQMMQPGAKWELYLPPELAYGRQGPLAHHAIIVEAELLSIDALAQKDTTEPNAEQQ